MNALTIDRLRLRYRIPPSWQDRRAELDRIREQVFGHALEAALAAEGLIGHEELCVRAINLPVRIDARLGRTAMVEQWTAALTRALVERLRAADPQVVVRYQSPLAALVDFARGVARGDLRRSWAWVSLGLVEAAAIERGPAALVESLVRTLLGRPEAIVAVLIELARTPPILRRLAASLSPAHSRALAEAALARHGLARAEREQVLAGRRDDERLVGDAVAVGLTAALGRSAIVAALRDRLTSRRPQTGDDRRARELAAPLAARSVAASFGDHEDEALVRAWVSLAALGEAPQQAPRWLVEQASALSRLLARQPSIEADELEDRPDPRPRPGRDADRRRDRIAAEPPDAARDLAELDRADASSDIREPEAEPEARPAVEPLQPWWEPGVARLGARTRFAGLLFLIPLMRSLDAWATLAALAARETRTGELRPLLHRLGRRLIGSEVADDDPALLAFVGLPPDSPPPVLEPLPDALASLDAALDRQREAVIAALEQRLALLQERRGEPLLAWLLAREAEVVADPGWIELRLQLRDVDPAIRRAGLDLDPDWLPALGVVVKFVYV
ncbi:MAG TPA: hypothetical protein VK034_13420 [Enhygromyxa sp.]|nr:hypothetical protein [Enhygromyxa sp.]